MTNTKVASITLIIAICLVGIMAVVFAHIPTGAALAAGTEAELEEAAQPEADAAEEADTGNLKLYIVIGGVAVLLLAVIIAAAVANKKYILAFIVGKHANPMAPQKHTAGSDLDQLPTPQRNGARFGGWYSDPYLKEEFTLTNMPKKDTYVYAKWRRTRWYYKQK